MKKPATKSSKKSATKRKQMIVFRDGAGNYYELSRATLQRGKVTGPRKKKIERLLKMCWKNRDTSMPRPFQEVL